MQRLGNALQAFGLIGFLAAMWLGSPIAFLAVVSVLVLVAGVMLERR